MGTRESSAPTKLNMAIVLDFSGILDNNISSPCAIPNRGCGSLLDHPMNKCISMLHGFSRMLSYFPHLGTFIPATLTFNQRNTFLSKKHVSLVCPGRNDKHSLTQSFWPKLHVILILGSCETYPSLKELFGQRWVSGKSWWSECAVCTYNHRSSCIQQFTAAWLQDYDN